MSFNVICKISEANGNFYKFSNEGEIIYIKINLFTNSKHNKYKKLKYVDIKEFSKVPTYMFGYCNYIKYLNLNVNKKADEECSYCGVLNGEMLKYIKLPNFYHSAFYLHNKKIICIKTKFLINNQKYYIPILYMRINK